MCDTASDIELVPVSLTLADAVAQPQDHYRNRPTPEGGYPARPSVANTRAQKRR
jgi:hypothetical protein